MIYRKVKTAGFLDADGNIESAEMLREPIPSPAAPTDSTNTIMAQVDTSPTLTQEPVYQTKPLALSTTTATSETETRPIGESQTININLDPVRLESRLPVPVVTDAAAVVPSAGGFGGGFGGGGGATEEEVVIEKKKPNYLMYVLIATGLYIGYKTFKK